MFVSIKFYASDAWFEATKVWEVKAADLTIRRVYCATVSVVGPNMVPISSRFDIKGSFHGRMTDKSKTEYDANATLKDLHLYFIFPMQKD
ncbi:phosphatidylinositol 4-phosphate 5-kinase 6-like protein [Tanacetum coccineum]